MLGDLKVFRRKEGKKPEIEEMENVPVKPSDTPVVLGGYYANRGPFNTNQQQELDFRTKIDTTAAKVQGKVSSGLEVGFSSRYNNNKFGWVQRNDAELQERMKRQSCSFASPSPRCRPRFHHEECQIAEHYSTRRNQSRQEREASPIIQLKKLNNWIKSVLIQLCAHNGDAVLDLACGKGGDLIKWHKANIGYYVGVDIAPGSVEDCRTRYNGDADTTRFNFPARLICGDCFEVGLGNALRDDGPFDICSCQFAMHYSWSTEARARQALANISALLRPGGTFIGTIPDAEVILKRLREAGGLVFGNDVYWIRFEDDKTEEKLKSGSQFGIKYKFHLEDAVDCPEWLVPFTAYKSLAQEYGLELVFVKNAKDFVQEYSRQPKFYELMRKLGALGDGKRSMSEDEWQVAYLYSAFMLRKRGVPTLNRRHINKGESGKRQLSKADILYLRNYGRG